MRDTNTAAPLASGTEATLDTVMSVLHGIRARQSNGEAYDDATRLADAGFTSLEMVQVMMATEAAFDIMIPQAMITTENFASAASIAAMVDKVLAR